jgi:hypothetical protein
METDCETIYPGNLGVALVIHFIRETDGSGGVPFSELPNILADIKSAYEPLGIYFRLKCTDEIFNSAFLSNGSNLLSLTTVYEDDSAMNLFLTLPNAGGVAYLGGRIAIAGYNSPNNTTTVVHELGHALGLHHTFAGTAALYGTDDNQAGSNNPPELVNGTDCCTRGDFVCDTPADPNIAHDIPGFSGLGAQPDCSWDTPLVTDQNGAFYQNQFPGGKSNFMSYYRRLCSESFFTEGQANRMRAFLHEQQSLQTVRRDEMIIADDVTWSTDTYVDVDITILNGGKLRIQNCSLFMAPGKRIVVEENAVLKVKNSTITVDANFVSDCSTSNFWHGIEIHGASTPSGQVGIANIYNSNIEYAENAVYLADLPGFYLPYGHLYTAHSTYRNNRVALNLFYDSPSSNPYATYLVIRCNFIVDENFPSPVNSSPYQVLIGNIGRTRFEGCNFSTYSLGDFSNSQGIFAYNSSPVIKSYCGPGYPDDPCPVNAFALSTFSGFKNGIQLINADGSTIEEVSFSNCLHGINAKSSNNLNIRDNIFTVANINNIQRSGIDLDECTGYTVDGNQFFVDNPDDLSLTSIGLYILKSGEDYNAVTNNSFTGLRRGIYVSGRNRNPSAPMIGLGLFCNTHDNADAGSQSSSGPFDVYTDFGATMASLQGSPDRPAGNLFSDNTITNGADFYYFNLSSQLDYWYKGNGASEEFPDNVFQVDRSPSDDDSNCGAYATANPANPTEVDVLYDTYADLLALWRSRMDGGDKEGLLTQIATTPRQQFQPVKTALADISPFLSAEVVAAAFQRTDAFQSSELQALVMNNPDVIKESMVKDAITGQWGINTLATMETNIAQGSSSPSARAVLETRIYDEARTVMPLINRGIQQMYQDSTLLDYTPLRAALAPKESLAAALQHAETYWREGNLVKYDLAANELLVTFATEPDIADYATFTGILLAQHQAGKPFKNMSATQIQSLVDLGTNCTNSLIRNRIGHFLYAYFQIELPAAGPSAQALQAGETGHTEQQSLSRNATEKAPTTILELEIYPNPVLGNGVITVVAPHAGEWEYVLTDINQQIQAKGKWGSIHTNTHTLDVRQYPRGIYFLSLQSASTTAQAKLIIQ